ncbi:MAG: helix-turn-helix domain-containing protein [Lachnospiraceae bacterium]
MEEYKENYIGELVKNERKRRGLSSKAVCSGICSMGVYSKLESGVYAGNVHVLRAVFERLGIDTERSGTYLAGNEYDEMMDRLYILEEIRNGDVSKAEERIEGYVKKYDNIPLNYQFITYMRARLTELKGKKEEALRLYDEAVKYTMPDYASCRKFECISVYECFMILNVARLDAVLGNRDKAVSQYKVVLEYCENSEVEALNKVCIYPKTICELLDIVPPDAADRKSCSKLYGDCLNAIEVLLKTGRVHYILPLLGYKKMLEQILDMKSEDKWDEFAGYYGEIRREYGCGEELLAWYPYYRDCDFRSVNELIRERREMHGMSLEELAGEDISTRQLARIIKGESSPSYNTAKRLLDKLGLKGVQRSNFIVADDIYLHKLWDECAECSDAGDYDREEKIYSEMISKLDTSIEINRMAMDFRCIKLNQNKKRIDCIEALNEYEKLLPFNLENVGKYKYLTTIEEIIINDCIHCIDMLKLQGKMTLMEAELNKYSVDELSKRRYASMYEGIAVRYANYAGNIGEYDKSSEVAEAAVKVMLDCERAGTLPTLLYCIAWNNGKCRNITARDIRLCKCAYRIAEYMGEEKRMRIYDAWLKRNS